MATHKSVKLGEIARFSQGIQIPIGDQASTPETEDHVRFIRIVDYTQNTDDIRYVKNPGRKYWVDESDIVMVRYGPIGVVGRGKAGVIANNMFKVTPSEDAIDKAFLFYCLSGDAVRNRLIRANTSTTMPAITFSMVEDLDIPLPEIEGQRRIVAILSAYDELMENIQRRIRLLEAMARALYREWFVHFRFPGHETYPRVASPLGDIPQGWEVKKLGDIADISWGDTSTTKASYVEEGYAAYSASGLDGKLDHYDFDRTGIVLSAIGAQCGKTWLACGKWSCIKNTIRFWSKHQCASTEFLYIATEGQDFWPRRGAAQPFISQGDAERIELLTPDPATMNRFTAFAANALEQIATLQEQIQNLRRTRDLLLPRLLAGNVHLKWEGSKNG